MKITINQLKRIIKEEVKKASKASYADGDYVVCKLSGAVYAENEEATVVGIIEDMGKKSAEVSVALSEGDDEDVPIGGGLTTVTVDLAPGGQNDGYIVRMANKTEIKRFLAVQYSEDKPKKHAKTAGKATWPGFVPAGSGFDDPSGLAEYDEETGGFMSKAAAKLGKSLDELMVCDTESEETTDYYDEYSSEIENEKEIKGWDVWAASGDFHGVKVIIINVAGMGMIIM